MRALALLLLLFVGCSTLTTGEPTAIRFDQLIENPRDFVGKTVRLRCTMGLFGERTIFTAAGMTPSFDCAAINLRSRGSWEKSDRYVQLGSEAREVLQQFRTEHPDLRWPEVEAEVDLVAKFEWPARVGNFTLTPIEILGFRLSRIIALEKDPLSRTLLTFPIRPKGPNQSPEPTAMSVTPPAAQESRQP
jgi:hypothetical protein